MKIDSEILQHISSADLAPEVAKHILRLILHILQVNQGDFSKSHLEFSTLSEKPQISQ